MLAQPIPLILASSSAIRQQMLRDVGLTFSVIPSGCDEDIIKRELATKPGHGTASETVAVHQCPGCHGKIVTKPGTK